MNYFDKNVSYLQNKHGIYNTTKLLNYTVDDSQFNSLLHEISLEDITGGIQDILPDYMDFSNVNDSYNYYVSILFAPVILITLYYLASKFIYEKLPAIKGEYNNKLTQEIRKITNNQNIKIHIAPNEDPEILYPQFGYVSVSSAAIDFFNKDELHAIILYGYYQWDDHTELKSFAISSLVSSVILVNLVFIITSDINEQENSYLLIAMKKFLGLFISIILNNQLFRRSLLQKDLKVAELGYGKPLISALKKLKNHLIEQACQDFKGKDKSNCYKSLDHAYDETSILESKPALNDRINRLEQYLNRYPNKGAAYRIFASKEPNEIALHLSSIINKFKKIKDY